tara:strand:- start:69 stop:434 length:366 start_codon:yes stop_codon:yes gene_type:complete
MFKSAAELGREFRSEIIPMLKSKGFDLRIASSKRSYYHDGKLNVSIIKVPTNFPVWTSEYSRWDRTDNADRLIATIKYRIKTLISNNNVELDSKGEEGLDVDVDVEFHRNVPWMPYEKDEK